MADEFKQTPVAGWRLRNSPTAAIQLKKLNRENRELKNRLAALEEALLKKEEE